jgi:hypothetical protein
MKYAGIGSRSAPPEACRLLAAWGERAARAGWLLRSGVAPGADTAFEGGCDAAGGLKEIFLPWAGFQGHPSRFTKPTEAAIRLAAGAHPACGVLKPAERLLHGRNAHQMFGPDLDDPVAMVLCWTEDGCESEVARTRHGRHGHRHYPGLSRRHPGVQSSKLGAEERLLGSLDAMAAEGEASADAMPRAR